MDVIDHMPEDVEKNKQEQKKSIYFDIYRHAIVKTHLIIC